MQLLWPGRPAAPGGRRLPRCRRLPPVTRTSIIVAPTAIALSAIRDALEAQAPRDLTGKRDNIASQDLVQRRDRLDRQRGPLGVFGKPDVLGVSTALTGTLRATGQISTAGGRRPRQRDRRRPRPGARTQRREARRPHARPARRHPRQCRGDRRGRQLTPAWRLEPNLTAQVSVADANMTIAASGSTSRTRYSRCSSGRSTSRSARCRRGCATIRSSSGRRGANGRSSAARSRSAPPAPGCRTCGSSSARRAPSRRSRASMPRPSRC